MYPEEIEVLGVLALLWLILRTIATAWVTYQYRKDPEGFTAQVERGRQRIQEDDNDEDDDWSFANDDINPATGLPMIGGIDVKGNPYGAGNNRL